MSSPFSQQSKLAWETYLLDPDHKSRFRPTVETLNEIHLILNQGLAPDGEHGRRLKYTVKRKYRLGEDGRLQYRLDPNLLFRYAVSDREVFDIVVTAHLNLTHAGIQKTYDEIDKDFYGIARHEVIWILKHCSTCAKKTQQKQTAPLRAIISTQLWERVQVDLIDMSASPDPEGNFKWICHMRDHFSKYSAAYPLQNKQSTTVAKAITIWIIHFGPPKILQCDNGSEFKGALLILAKSLGIKIINGRARHPQSQGLIEQANAVLKEKLAAWSSDHQSACWAKGLPECILAMNGQKHSTIRQVPYELVFGQKVFGSRVPFMNRNDESLVEEELEVNSTPSTQYGLQLEPIDRNLESSGEASYSNPNTSEPSRSQIRNAALLSSANARTVMIRRGSERHQKMGVLVGDLVSLRIPRSDRSSLDNKRLICRVIKVLAGDRFELRTEYGKLNRSCYIGELHRIVDTISFNPQTNSEHKLITIRRAAQLENNKNRQINISCSCTSRCATNRCSCYKANRICNINCHVSGKGKQKACTNISPAVLRESSAIDISAATDDSSENIIILAQPSLVDNVSQLATNSLSVEEYARTLKIPDINWITDASSDDSFAFRLEADIVFIENLIQNYQNLPDYHRYSSVRNSGAGWYPMKNVCSGYYSFRHFSIPALLFHLDGRDIEGILTQRMTELGEVHDETYNLILEVVAPVILQRFISRDMGISMEDADTILRDEKVMEYGNMVRRNYVLEHGLEEELDITLSEEVVVNPSKRITRSTTRKSA